MDLRAVNVPLRAKGGGALQADVGHNKPLLGEMDGRTEFYLVDPFGNRLRFGEIEQHA
jgi:hypothetical protein